MKSRILKTLAVFMALNILFSATGFAVFEHSCHAMGLVTTSLVKEDGCSMSLDTERPPSEELSYNQGACCEEHTSHQHISVETGNSFEKLDLPSLVLGVQDFNRLSEKYFIVEASLAVPSYHLPPDLGVPIFIKFQSFRI